MHADMVDLVGVLARATRAVHVGLVFQDLHPAALAAALLPALFLRRSNETRQLGSGIEQNVDILIPDFNAPPTDQVEEEEEEKGEEEEIVEDFLQPHFIYKTKNYAPF